MRTIMTAMAMVAAMAFGAVVSAKLPAPPPQTEEQKAKAAETKAKADEAAKKETEALGHAQDRAADNYKKNKGIAPAVATKTAAKKK